MVSDSKLNQFHVGELVWIKGTGQYWSGSSYQAHIVDVPTKGEKANTVKVQYADGGFKRFPKSDFEGLVVQIGAEDDSNFGTKDYEWAHDQYAPATQLDTELDDLRLKMTECIQRKDFLGAEQLKQAMLQRSAHQNLLKQLQRHLIAAVERQNFVEADKLQKNIDELLVKKAFADEKAPKEVVGLNDVFEKAKAKAFRGGLAGMGAMVLQVCSLMWMRTIMNFQYRNGTSLRVAASTLYKQGGIPRFYAGIVPALAQGPLSRFGDTAANVGMLTLLDNLESTKDLNVAVKTIGASAAAAGFRIFLMPIDTFKTMMQVEGKAGFPKLMAKIKVSPFALWHGSLGASLATFAGHYPWFATYNLLNEHLPKPVDTLGKLGRNAFMGFCASFVSDTTSNSIRVLKTYRQTSEVKISYMDAASAIIAKDGLQGLFFRGLGTRLIANGVQGMAFSVGFKYLEEQLAK